MKKQDIIKLALAGLIVGLAAQPADAAENNENANLSASALAAHNCGGAGCGGAKRNSNTAANCGGGQRSTADNRNMDNRQQHTARDDFRDSLDQSTRELYDTLTPEEKKSAWQMVNNGKKPNEAVKEVAQKKSPKY